jgi:hypothetical protein
MEVFDYVIIRGYSCQFVANKYYFPEAINSLILS